MKSNHDVLGEFRAARKQANRTLRKYSRGMFADNKHYTQLEKCFRLVLKRILQEKLSFMLTENNDHGYDLECAIKYVDTDGVGCVQFLLKNNS